MYSGLNFIILSLSLTTPNIKDIQSQKTFRENMSFATLSYISVNSSFTQMSEVFEDFLFGRLDVHTLQK